MKKKKTGVISHLGDKGPTVDSCQQKLIISHSVPAVLEDCEVWLKREWSENQILCAASAMWLCVCACVCACSKQASKQISK